MLARGPRRIGDGPQLLLKNPTTTLLALALLLGCATNDTPSRLARLYPLGQPPPQDTVEIRFVRSPGSSIPLPHVAIWTTSAPRGTTISQPDDRISWFEPGSSGFRGATLAARATSLTAHQAHHSP